MSEFRPLAFNASHFNVADKEKFAKAISLLKESLECKGATLFSGDNMLLWNKGYSFLRKEEYLNYVTDSNTAMIPKSIVWRTYVLDYFMKRSLKAKGDMLELGVLKGRTAKFLCEMNRDRILDRKYILIDLFEWKPGDSHTAHSDLKRDGLFEEVRAEFVDFPFTEVIKGDVKKVLPMIDAEDIAFAHIDMNAAEPELFALDYLLPKMAEGGAIVLDDYGWYAYWKQTVAINKLLDKHGLEILELPTGQGVLIF